MPRILLVEDEPSERRVYANELARHADATTVSTLAEARAVLRDEHLDGVVLDLTLPDGDGLSLVPVARVSQPHAHLLLFSASCGPEVLARAAELGVVFGLKPGTALLRELALRCGARPASQTVVKPARQRIRTVLGAAKLTNRETDIIELGLEGVHPADVPGRLGISERSPALRLSVVCSPSIGAVCPAAPS